MKLSMWMIANRLPEELEKTCKISENDRPVLRSARLVYATDCVYVHMDGDDVVYTGTESSIRLHGISLLEGFEILQSIFDDFREWEDCVKAALTEKNYQRMIDVSVWMIQNPMILLDGNRILLGISREPEPNQMDEEWKYLLEHRHSSVKIARTLYLESEAGASGRIRRVKENPKLKYGGITCEICAENRELGLLTILEKNRSINKGDEQLARYLCTLLENSMSEQETLSGQNYLYNLLFGGRWNEKDLALQLSYLQWKEEDLYQIVLIEPKEHRNVEVSVNLLVHAMRRTVPGCAVLRQNPYVILISNWEIAGDINFHSAVRAYTSEKDIRLGFSLALPGILSLPYLFRQADYTLRRTRAASANEENILFFRDCGVMYLLASQDPEDKIHAIHPGVYYLWQRYGDDGDELYRTLEIFLDTERSYSRTAALLYTHRNTVLYRIRKAEGILNEDLNDAQIRGYIRLSMLLLEETGKQKDERKET